MHYQLQDMFIAATGVGLFAAAIYRSTHVRAYVVASNDLYKLVKERIMHDIQDGNVVDEMQAFEDVNARAVVRKLMFAVPKAVIQRLASEKFDMRFVMCKPLLFFRPFTDKRYPFRALIMRMPEGTASPVLFMHNQNSCTAYFPIMLSSHFEEWLKESENEKRQKSSVKMRIFRPELCRGNAVAIAQITFDRTLIDDLMSVF